MMCFNDFFTLQYFCVTLYIHVHALMIVRYLKLYKMIIHRYMFK